jgi:hypothetical protein
MYFPRNQEFGSALSKLRNFGGGGGFEPPNPPRYTTDTVNNCNIMVSTVRSESHCALRLRYVDLVQACIDARGPHFQHLSYVQSDFPNADLLKVFANKIKRVLACIDARGHHFNTFYKWTATLLTHWIMILYHNIMGPQSYMRSVVNRNVVMRGILVLMLLHKPGYLWNFLDFILSILYIL